VTQAREPVRQAGDAQAGAHRASWLQHRPQQSRTAARLGSETSLGRQQKQSSRGLLTASCKTSSLAPLPDVDAEQDWAPTSKSGQLAMSNSIRTAFGCSRTDDAVFKINLIKCRNAAKANQPLQTRLRYHRCRQHRRIIFGASPQ